MHTIDRQTDRQKAQLESATARITTRWVGCFERKHRGGCLLLSLCKQASLGIFDFCCDVELTFWSTCCHRCRSWHRIRACSQQPAAARARLYARTDADADCCYQSQAAAPWPPLFLEKSGRPVSASPPAPSASPASTFASGQRNPLACRRTAEGPRAQLQSESMMTMTMLLLKMMEVVAVAPLTLLLTMQTMRVRPVRSSTWPLQKKIRLHESHTN